MFLLNIRKQIKQSDAIECRINFFMFKKLFLDYGFQQKMMNSVLIMVIYVVKHFIVSCIDFCGWSDKVWKHIESRFDINLWHVASICHPSANEKVFNEIIGQLKCNLIQAFYFG